MKWEKVKLGDVTDSCLGKMLDKEKNRGEYQLYLSNKDVRWGSFDLEHLDLMKFEEHEEERYGVRYGDLIVCEGGEPGRCAIWKDQIPNMKIQKALHRVRVHEGLDYRFLYYWFLWAGKRGELQQYFTGATIKHMPGDKLKSVIITKPDIETQRQIADVLSAYDDLIENNQKQIKLLEEAAQRLYKEWFVNLRFPGHENTEILDGIPAGWRIEEVGKLIGKVPRTTQIMTANYHKSGKIPIIDQSKTFIAGYTDDETALVDLGEPVIVFGDHTRILKFIQFPFAKGADGTQLIVSANKNMPQSLLYCGLVNIDLSNYHYARHFKYLKAESLLVPIIDIAKQFDEYAGDLFKRIQVLRDEISSATEARDRLLPKLMSGEIEL